MPGEQCADRVSRDIGDLFEAELTVMSQLDDFSVTLGEQLHRSSELSRLCLSRFLRAVVVACISVDPAEMLRSRGSRVAGPLAAIVADPVHGDPEKPG
ncbi:MAG: hypothetical protein NXI07_13000, partial [bacterium]|nr:hypothetical protein [bacterium]